MRQPFTRANCGRYGQLARTAAGSAGLSSVMLATMLGPRLDAEVAPRHERQLRDVLRTVCGAARSLDGKGEGELLADRVDNEVKTLPVEVGAIEHPPLPQALIELLGSVYVDPLYLR